MPIAINGSGTVTGISVGGLPDGIVDTDMIAAKAATAAKLGNGSILQVVQTAKTNDFSHSGNTNVVDITGLNVDITPISSSSKILIYVYLCFHNGNISRVQIVRGTTAIGIGDASGSRPRQCLVIVVEILMLCRLAL